jgi:hypothetical protein
MDNQSHPSPLTPISSMHAGINPDEFDDPEFSDDGSSLLSSAPNTLMTPVFGSSSRSADSSASDTTGPGTAGSTMFKRKKIKRKSYVFNTGNGVEYTSKEGTTHWEK